MRQCVYTSLLLIIRVCFTCGERKIWSNIRNPQNIMTMVIHKKKFVSRSQERLWFHIEFILTLCYKTRQMLVQNATAILLQNTSGFFYSKMWQLLQILAEQLKIIFKYSNVHRLLLNCFRYTRWISTPL